MHTATFLIEGAPGLTPKAMHLLSGETTELRVRLDRMRSEGKGYPENVPSVKIPLVIHDVSLTGSTLEITVMLPPGVLVGDRPLAAGVVWDGLYRTNRTSTGRYTQAHIRALVIEQGHAEVWLANEAAPVKVAS